jgi:hypothetical protein
MPFFCWVRDPEPGEGVSTIPEFERADGRHLGGSDGLPLLRGGGTWGQGGKYYIMSQTGAFLVMTDEGISCLY